MDDFEGPDSNCTVCVLNLNLDVIGMKSTSNSTVEWNEYFIEIY